MRRGDILPLFRNGESEDPVIFAFCLRCKKAISEHEWHWNVSVQREALLNGSVSVADAQSLGDWCERCVEQLRATDDVFPLYQLLTNAGPPAA